VIAGKHHHLDDGAVDRCRFERFEETGTQSYRDDVADPGILKPPDLELDIAARFDLASQNAFDLCVRLVWRTELVGIDITATVAKLGGNLPHPPGFLGPGAGVVGDLVP